MGTQFYLSMRKLTFVLGMQTLLLLAQQASAACTCDPDMSFSTKAEWAGPYSAQASVDVNKGNTPESFIAAAYWQIAGVAPPAAFVTDHANRLRTWGYWRRIDTVNTILTTTGNSGKARTYSDAWTTEPALSTAPCKTLTRDVGAVFMLFFNCPAPPGYNCGMQWANNHTVGMATGDGLYGGGLYDRSNVQFYQRELMDARYAGLQFFLPNIYGWEMADGDVDKLKTALDNIAASGISSQVKVGLFDDSWGWGQRTLGVPDMSNTVAASDYIFNTKWAPYFDKIPDAYRYKVGGKPMIYMYSAGNILHANDYNVFARLKTLFQTRYGVAPYLVVDVAYWNASGAANMGTVADNQFTWRPATNLPNGNSSTYTKNAVTLTHSMPRWDPIGRDSNGDVNRVANASDGIIKGANYLQNALNSSTASQLLVFATWNDLGEGTAINRAIDYYDAGNWLRPTYFMDQIRASQSQQSCGVLLPTATATPTISPTFTLTTTPTHGPLVTDMNTVGVQDRTLWNGGAIVQYKDSNGTTSNHSPWTPSAGTSPGASGSGYAACWAGNLVASSPTAGIYPYSFLAFEVSPNGAANAANGGTFTNVLPYSTNKGIQFNYKAGAAGVVYQVEITTSQVLDYGYYAYQWTAPDTAWHSLTVYFPDVASSPRFAQPAWAVQRAWDPTTVGALIFQPLPQTTAVGYSLCIDDLTFQVPVPPTFTPTPSPSRTASPTPSRTPSATPSFTPTATSSPSPTSSRTSSPSATVSPAAATGTPSSTPTRTGTSSSTATGTASPGNTATATPTRTPTSTGTASVTASGTVSPANTGTFTPTRTNTSSATPSSTVSASPTATRTATPSATRSASPSASPSGTPSATITVTSTPPPVGSSPTPSPTTSPSFSASPTASRTATGSATPSETPSATASATRTATGSVTPSSTLSPANSATLTLTPANTATTTPANSATLTPANSATTTAVSSATTTPVNSATTTPASSATTTPVNSATTTPANSATTTPAASATASPAASATRSATPTATASATPSVSPSRTASLSQTPANTATASATLTPANSATLTPVATGTATPANSATLTPVATATTTPVLSGPTATSTTVVAPPTGIDPPKIEELVAYPNPQRGPRYTLRVKLKGPADGVSLRCYSRGMTVLGVAELGAPLGAGWNELAFQQDGLPAGACFVQVRTLAREGRGVADSKTVKLLVLP